MAEYWETWQLNRSLPECNKYMLDNEIEADVAFMVCFNDDVSGYKLIQAESSEDEESECQKPDLKKARILSTDSGISLLNSPAIQGSQKLKHIKESGSRSENETRRRRFLAHKYVLVSRSPVFRAMLSGLLAEKGEITIEDIEVEAFEQMLNFIYTDSADLTLDNVIPVIYAAKKYLLPRLEELCYDFFTKNLNASNACILLEHCICVQEMELAKKCMWVIMFQTADCMKAKSALLIEKETLMRILALKLISVRELEVFQFCNKWATMQCLNINKEAKGENIREILGNGLQKINFSLFTSEEMADFVLPTNILEPDVALKFFHCRYSTNPVDPPENFLNVERYVDVHKLFSLGYFKNRVLSPEVESFSCVITLDVKIPIVLKKLYVSCLEETAISTTRIKYCCTVDDQPQIGLSDSLHRQGNIKISVLEFALPILLEEGNHSALLNCAIQKRNDSSPASSKLYVTRKTNLSMSINSVSAFNICNQEITDLEGDFFAVFGAEFSFHPKLFSQNDC